MNVSNLMKPLLTQGEFRCIGATTQAEYRRYLEGDAALERRFQRVRIFPPSFAETINILRGLKERYELFHGVRIEEDAINAAVKLSIRYITDRNLPDKAIDLLDETCAIARTNIDSTPDQLEK